MSSQAIGPVDRGRPSADTARLWIYATIVFVLLLLFAPHASVAQEAGGGSRGPLAPNLKSLEQSFQRVIERVAPSVVGIRVQRRYFAALTSDGGSTRAEDTEQLVSVNGSGTIIDARGLLLTNEHVVQGASRIEILYPDGSVGSATLVASDARSDLAILRLDRQGLQPARLCEWQRVARGQWSIALGNPYGLGGDGRLSASIGVISNLGRRLPGLGEVDDRLYTDMIQTTASINPGNSGGPLFNIDGELVGVVTAMHTRAGADDGVGFAIPMSPQRRRVIDQLTRGEPVAYGYLGVTARVLNEAERSRTGPDSDACAAVQLVEPGGPADHAGIREGDLILSFDGSAAEGPARLAELVGGVEPGRIVQVELLRASARLVLDVQIERREVSRVSWMRGEAIFWRGMRLANLTAGARERMQVSATATGIVVIDVSADSPAAGADIHIGDVIERVAGAPVENVIQFQRVTELRDGEIALTVRNRGTRHISAQQRRY